MTCPTAIYLECLSPEAAESTFKVLLSMIPANPRLRSQRWLNGVAEDSPSMPPDNNPLQNPCVVKLLVASLDSRLIAAIGEHYPIRRITQDHKVLWEANGRE